MNEEHTMMLSKALEPFGAHVSREGIIVRGNREISSVALEVVGDRLRFVGQMYGYLIMSGPVSGETIQNFVKEFWHWEKKNNVLRCK